MHRIAGALVVAATLLSGACFAIEPGGQKAKSTQQTTSRERPPARQDNEDARAWNNSHWLISSGNDYAVFLRPVDIVELPNQQLRYWYLWVNHDASKDDLNQKYTKILLEGSCALRQSRLLQVSGYDSAGRSTGTSNYERSSQPSFITPGTVGETIMRFACAPARQWAELGAEPVLESVNPVEYADLVLFRDYGAVDTEPCKTTMRRNLLLGWDYSKALDSFNRCKVERGQQ